MVAEYFKKGSRDGIRFGIMIDKNGKPFIRVNPVNKSEDGETVYLVKNNLGYIVKADIHPQEGGKFQKAWEKALAAAEEAE